MRPLIARLARWAAFGLAVTLAGPGTPARAQSRPKTPRTEPPAGRPATRPAARSQVGTPVPIPLGFKVSGFALGPDGRRAVAWGDPTGGGGFGGPPTPPRVALVDLDAGRVLATRELTAPVSRAAVDRHQMYLITQNTNLIQVLRPEKGELAPARRLFTRGPAQRLQALPNDLLLVRDEGLSLLTVPNLQPVRDPARRLGAIAPGGGQAGLLDAPDGLPYRIKDGWVVAGNVVALDKGTVRLLVTPPAGFPALPMQTPAHWSATGPFPLAPLQWDRSSPPGSNTITPRSGSTIAPAPAGHPPHSYTLSPPPWSLMVDEPAGVRLAAWKEQADLLKPEARIKAELSLVSLADGSIVQTYPLVDRPASPEDVLYAPRGTDEGMPQSVGRRLICGFDDHLYCLTLSDAQAKALPVPLGIIPVQDTLALATDRTTVLEYATRGGRPPLTFTLAGTADIAGLAVDGATGAITADGPQLQKAAIGLLVDQQLLPAPERPNPDPQKFTREPAIAETIARLGPAFQQITGRKPGGVPLLVPIVLTAADADGQTATLIHHVFLEVPREPLAEALRAFEGRQRAEQVAARDSHQPAQAATTPTPPGGDPPTDADARLRALEEKMKALEARIDLLTRLLQEQLDKQP